MGNLRDNCTDEEWNELEERAKQMLDLKYHFISLHIKDKTIKELKSLYKKLSEFYEEYDLSDIKRVIKYKEKLKQK